MIAAGTLQDATIWVKKYLCCWGFAAEVTLHLRSGWGLGFLDNELASFLQVPLDDDCSDLDSVTEVNLAFCAADHCCHEGFDGVADGAENAFSYLFEAFLELRIHSDTHNHTRVTPHSKPMIAFAVNLSYTVVML